MPCPEHGLYGVTFHLHASCTSDSHPHLHGVKNWVSILTPLLCPLLPIISPTQMRPSLLHLFPSPIPWKSHLHSQSLPKFLVPRKRLPEPIHDPLLIPTPSPPSPHAGEGYHVLPPVLRPQGCHVSRSSSLFSHPALSTDLLHTAGLAPSCHRRH